MVGGTDLVVLRLKDISDQIVPKIADSFEVFDFDPVIRSRIRTWFAGGADGNVLRVCQGETVTDPDILLGQRAPQTNGPDGTVQKVIGDANSPDYFYPKMTDAFLRHNAPRLVPPNDLHHAVPKLFLAHAIKTTQF